MTSLSRYRRQISLPDFGVVGQEALSRSHVAVIGAGGLGSPALLYLAGAGVGRVTVIDDDAVDLSNLHRQVIHLDAGVGQPKAGSAAAAMNALNPEITVTAVTGRLTSSNALELLGDADVVLDGADNFDTRHLASWACARLGIPHVWASILGHDAQLSVFHAGHGPIYEDIYREPPAPGVVPNCAQAGVLGPVVGVVGSAMALEAIKLLTGLGRPLTGRLGVFSGLDGTWEYVPVVGTQATLEQVLADGPVTSPALPPVPEITELPYAPLLIDVREPHEFAGTRIPGALNVPLGTVLEGDWVPPAPESGRDVVIYCAGGIRSARAVRALAERGVTGPVSLAGGIDAWLERQG
ncbi:ThiF family adenylyltransferase [Corynebacterium comes]|uniref:Adenylyltransferase/sulfurtransferase MoeZ n=1 Tax=Corynebacterium comes TaxID=2675218 RepID=A0A6B8VH76_9CORY|nr:ThiF family adenylyltransferase [Corynebacterium comes]QGU03523.1 putative adenylyltransferase/sulfurtransferase MoeZ [Corynebacterium comes]